MIAVWLTAALVTLATVGLVIGLPVSVRWLRLGMTAVPLALEVASLPLLWHLWARGDVLDGLSRVAAASAIGAGAGSAALLWVWRLYRIRTLDYLGEIMGTARIIHFPQAPETEYLRVEPLDGPTRHAWIRPDPDPATAPHRDGHPVRWDDALIGMGWLRRTPWITEDDQPTCGYMRLPEGWGHHLTSPRERGGYRTTRDSGPLDP